MLSVAKSGWLNREGIHETSIVRWIGGAERKVNEKIVLLSFITHSSSCKHFILMLTVFEHQASHLISFSSAYPWGSQGVLPHFIPLFQGVAGFLEPRVHPVMSHQLIAGPLLMAEAATQGANCTWEAILGFSILLKDTLTCSSVLPQGILHSNQRLVNQLYPVSYSCPPAPSINDDNGEYNSFPHPAVVLCSAGLLQGPPVKIELEPSLSQGIVMEIGLCNDVVSLWSPIACLALSPISSILFSCNRK